MKRVWKLFVAVLLFALCTPAQNVEAKTKYNLYGNARFGYEIRYPSFFKQSKPLPYNNDGIIMKGKGAELRMYGGHQVLYSTGKQMKKKMKEWYPKAKFVKVTKKECIFYYNKGSKQIYHYSYFVKKKWKGITSEEWEGIISYEITYPKSKRKEFEKYQTKMTKSIKALN